MAELTSNPYTVGMACLLFLGLVFLVIIYPTLVLSGKQTDRERERELYYLERNHGDAKAAWDEYVAELMEEIDDSNNN